MRTFSVIGLILLVSGCATTPPAPPPAQAVKDASLFNYVGNTCVQKGLTQNQAATAAMLNASQAVISRAPAQAQQFTAAIMAETPPQKVASHHCRLLEVRGVQLMQVQQSAQNERIIAQQQEAIQAQTQAAQQYSPPVMPQYQPRTVHCRHLEWGNMTTCNAF